MDVPKRLYWLIALNLSGFLLALYQTFEFFQFRSGEAGFHRFCDVSARFDCSTVEMSRWAEFLPGFPLSGFVSGWFLAIAIILWMGTDPYRRRESIRAGLLMTGFGLTLGLFYLWIMISEIQALCLFCLISDGLLWISLGLLLSMKPESTKKFPIDKSQWKPFIWTTLGCLVFTNAFGKMTEPSGVSNQVIQSLVRKTLQGPTETIPADDFNIQIGPKDAPIVLVKYSDFQCPSCGRGAQAIHPILKKYQDQVRLIYKNYPLDSSCNPKMTRQMHPAACEASRVAYCAHKQGSFEDVYHLFFENQKKLKKGSVIELIKKNQIPLDYSALQDCASSEESLLYVKRDLEEGDQIGIQSTPTFFVNGKKVLGAFPPRFWSSLFDRILDARR